MSNQTSQLGHDYTGLKGMLDAGNTATQNKETARHNQADESNVQYGNATTRQHYGASDAEAGRHNKADETITSTNNSAVNANTATANANVANQQKVNEQNRVREADRQSILYQQNLDFRNRKAFEDSQKAQHEMIMNGANKTHKYEGLGQSTKPATPPNDWLGNMLHPQQPPVTAPKQVKITPPDKRPANIKAAQAHFDSLSPEAKAANKAGFEAFMKSQGY
jgi:hypothetical protein